MSLKNKIVLYLSLFITIVVSIVIFVVSWQLQQRTVEQAALLSKELVHNVNSTVNQFHSLTKSILDNYLQNFKKLAASLNLNSPIAPSISRGQNEAVVEFLQTFARSGGNDFTLIFSNKGELQASSAGLRVFRPGDTSLPTNITSFEDLFLLHKLNDILQKELSSQLSPQEASELEQKSNFAGTVWLPTELLINMGISKEKISDKGAIAFVTSGIIRDDFFMPLGISLIGKLLTNFDDIFQQILQTSDFSTSLFIGTTPIASFGFQKYLQKYNNNSQIELKVEDAARIQKSNLPVDVTFHIAGDKFYSTCSSIEDIYAEKIGALCTSMHEDQILAVQGLVSSHSNKTKNTLQLGLLIAGTGMVVIGFVCALLFAKQFTKPIDLMVKMVDKAGKGDLSPRLNSRSVDELGILARAFDSMLDNLSLAEREREKLERQVRLGQKMEAIGTLAGGIAHDFNNILGAIIGYGEMIRDDCPAGSTTFQDINQILNAANRAKDLVKQILAFSRQAATERIPLQLASIVKEALSLLRSSLPTTIAIKQEIDADVGVVLADSTQIHQILINLCTNAFHAMETKGGTLTVSLHRRVLTTKDLVATPHLRPGSFVQLSVQDTGSGIMPEIREKIFEPFFTTKEIGKGTGMGLAMIHGIVQTYGGFITFDSKLGEGTVFHVILPMVDDVALHGKKTAEQIPIGDEHILLIDDEQLLLEVCSAMLKRLGYQVTAIMDSVEAFATFQEEPETFDIVITDQTMPIMTGVDLSQRILQIRPDIPIILCTGYSGLVTEETARSMGIKGFAMKPLATKEIAKLIRTILDERHPQEVKKIGP